MADFIPCPRCGDSVHEDDFIDLGDYGHPHEGEVCIDCANELTNDLSDIAGDIEGSEFAVNCTSCCRGFDLMVADSIIVRNDDEDFKTASVCPHCGEADVY